MQQLHERLRELHDRLGPEAFDDADSFRGALDDFLDEGAAGTGDINVLVDAVRLGAYRRLTALVASGASPEAAVEASGDLLARERGSRDTPGCRWACAVLGYATHKVPVDEVARYRPVGPGPGGPPAPGDPTSTGPPFPPVVSPVASPMMSPPHHPHVASSDPHAPRPYGAGPGHPVHRQKDERIPIIVAALVVLAVVIVVVLVIALN